MADVFRLVCLIVYIYTLIDMMDNTCILNQQDMKYQMKFDKLIFSNLTRKHV